MPYGELGELELLYGKARILNKQSPEKNWKQAVEYLNKALEQTPMEQSILLLLAECDLESAEWNHSPESYTKHGLEIVESVIQKNPRNSEAWLLKAKLQFIKNPSASKVSLEKAFQLNRNLQKEIAEFKRELPQGS
jgi:lipopolysaccharide biosynthesis regulator YciM